MSEQRRILRVSDSDLTKTRDPRPKLTCNAMPSSLARLDAGILRKTRKGHVSPASVMEADGMLSPEIDSKLVDQKGLIIAQRDFLKLH